MEFSFSLDFSTVFGAYTLFGVSAGGFQPSLCVCVYVYNYIGHLCGLVVRAPGYRSIGPGSIPGATRFSEK
jgi:hypothetical protein